MELEKMLKEEIKLRNKAEKKLKFLKKKLESLNIFVESSEQSSSEVSCRSSSTATSSSTTNDLSEENISIFLESSQIFSDNFRAKKILEKIPSQVEDNPIGQATTSSTSSNSPEDFTFDNPSCKSEDSKSENYRYLFFLSSNLKSTQVFHMGTDIFFYILLEGKRNIYIYLFLEYWENKFLAPWLHMGFV